MRVFMVAVAALAAGPAAAQEVLDTAAARRILFNERRVEVVIHPQPFLSEAAADVLRDVAEGNVPYYGAIAVSPDQGLATEATTARGNYHDAAAAAAAALADCNARRATGSTPCVVVAETRPKDWEPRGLQLSQGATSLFRRDYRRGREQKAFAVSPTSGGFGIGRGATAAAAAIASCNAAGGVADCRVVIAD